MASTDHIPSAAARTREWGGAPPALMIGLLAVIVVLIVVVGVGLAQKKGGGNVETVVEETDNNKELNALLKKISEAERMMADAMKLRTEDDKKDEFQAKLQETLDYVLQVKDEWDAMLEPLRREDGSLPPEYEGYYSDAQRLGYIRQDLVKQLNF